MSEAPPLPRQPLDGGTAARSDSSEEAPLEKKLGDLMEALKANSSDDWEGKPRHPEDDAFVAQLMHTRSPRNDTRGVDSNIHEHAGTAAAALHPNAAATHPPTLDDLMSTYISQLRGLRAFDECQGEQQMTATAAPVEGAANGTDADFAALLVQLDALPPLARKGGSAE